MKLAALLIAGASAFAPVSPARTTSALAAESRRELFSTLAGAVALSVASPALAVPGVFPPDKPSAKDPSMLPTMTFGRVPAPYGPRDGLDIWTQNGVNQSGRNGNTMGVRGTAGSTPEENGYDQSRGIYGWVKKDFVW